MLSSTSNQQSALEASLEFTEVPEDKQQENINSVTTKEKQISLNKFYLTPNNNEYFIGMIRVLQENEFRVAMMDQNNCWFSRSETFEKNNISSQNIHQFRNHVVSALTEPNDQDFEIEEIDTDKINKNKKHKFKYKKIQIFRKVHGKKYELAKFTLYEGKKNLFYVLAKLESTLDQKIRKNEQYKGDNKKYQKQYNQLMDELDETISEKNEQEKQLLSKFVLVLNEKKKKIRALQDEILQLKSQAQNGDVTDVDNVQNKNKNKNKNKKEEMECKDDNGNDIGFDLSMAIYDSDDLEAENKNKRNRLTVIDDGTLDIEGFDGLSGQKRKRDVLEEDDEQSVEPEHKRRKVAKKRKKSRKSEM